jgi:hypothetical protein
VNLFEFLFQSHSLSGSPLICGPQRYNLHFHSCKAFIKNFKTLFTSQKRSVVTPVYRLFIDNWTRHSSFAGCKDTSIQPTRAREICFLKHLFLPGKGCSLPYPFCHHF